MEQPKKPGQLRLKVPGRPPSLYRQEMLEEIMEEISQGKTLKEICGRPGMPHTTTVHGWVRKHPEVLPAWEAAKVLKSHSIMDEVLGLARALTRDEGRAANANQARALAIGMEALRDIAGKLNPREYGPKQTTTAVVPIQINTNLNLGQEGPVETNKAENIYNIEIPLQLEKPHG